MQTLDPQALNALWKDWCRFTKQVLATRLHYPAVILHVHAHCKGVKHSSRVCRAYIPMAEAWGDPGISPSIP